MEYLKEKVIFTWRVSASTCEYLMKNNFAIETIKEFLKYLTQSLIVRRKSTNLNKTDLFVKFENVTSPGLP